MPERDPLEDIVDRLDRHHQRATHGAVAAHLGRVARSLMQGKAPSRRYSWIVAKKTGEPTGYPPEQVHPALKERSRILTSRRELEEWLEAVEPAEDDSGDEGTTERARGGWAAVMRVVAFVAGAWRFVTGR